MNPMFIITAMIAICVISLAISFSRDWTHYSVGTREEERAKQAYRDRPLWIGFLAVLCLGLVLLGLD